MFNAIFSQSGFFLTLLLLALGATGSLLAGKHDRWANFWSHGCAIAASILGLFSAVSVLLFGSVFTYNLATALPVLSLSFQMDQLSAFFIFVISLIALFASVYALGYVKHYYQKYNIGALGFFYNLFLAGMIMVVSAHNALFFLVVWEIMSLASYFLVVFEKKEPANVKAGRLYFIMTHIGTAFIMLAFLWLYSATGSLDFEVIKSNIGLVAPLARNLIFILALIGFGTKAGIIPLHIWLPSAHPAAPTHVSALMSGVMIKTGVYMLIRIGLDIMPGQPLWWGVVVLLVGATSALLGVLYVLTEGDIKKLLAYSSIENIGIILLGLGSAFIFFAADMKFLAALGLAAALFHVLNHAIFKALLFMGAGSVISQTHTRNMEEYGGLIKYMPQTACFFLVGAMAISALPPLNGFFSEWMVFQSLFNGIRSLDYSVQWIFVLGAIALAFTSGLAAAGFVKVVGATFLARPRGTHAQDARESGLAMRIAMGGLAVLTVLAGVFASLIAVDILKVVNSLDSFDLTGPIFYANTGSLVLRDGFAAVSMPLIWASLLLILSAVSVVVYFFTHHRKVCIGRTWDCGTNLGPRMEITGAGFSRSLITIFRGILQSTKQTETEYHDASIRYFPKANVVRFEIKDIYQIYFYRPIQTLTTNIAERVKQIQGGNINAYVLYIFLILIILLLFLVI